jgi:signal transduction histidine kinase
MMELLKNLSIRSKLLIIILGTTILALVSGFLVMILYGVRIFKEDMVSQTQTMARVVGRQSIPELEFMDQEGAATTLSKLESISELIYASLLDHDGRLFASFPETPQAEVPPPEMNQDYRFDDDHLYVVEQLTSEDEFLGTLHLCVSTVSLRKRINNFIVMVSLLVTGLIVLATFAAVKLQGVISGPILQLAGAARQISLKGDYSERVSKAGDDEVGVLFDAWNEMLGQIEQRQYQQERYANELERSNRDLDQFAYAVSHDLRAPLRAIRNLSAWIDEDLSGVLTGDSRQHMDLLRKRVERMDRLIAGILEYSRVGRTRVSSSEVDVGRLIRDVVDDLAPPASFSIVIGEGMPTLVTESVRLAQVFANLIGNAIKHHDREDGRIEISCENDAQGGVYSFTVADDGPGIAPEHHEKIFLMFQTLQPRDVHDTTGLGLALVKRIVEDHGGDLQVVSQPGQGAAFRFSWPMEPQDTCMEIATGEGTGDG